jgi:pyrimidine-nucleoside phosphorylase
MEQLADIGLVLAGQTADLAPADGKLYALRDVTGTVSSMPLIAASIMSKKLAGGADAIVLDVKTGSGAFMPTVDAARDLARTMVDIGVDAGRKVTALISDMNQPLGYAVGNALEIREAIETLRGAGPPDFWKHCLGVASHMLLLSNRVSSEEVAQEQIAVARENGRALEKFRQMVARQGGDVSQINEPQRLPQAPLQHDVLSPQSGYLAGMNTAVLGWAAVHLGAGRQRKGQAIDHAVGFVMPVKVGARIHQGDLLATIHAQSVESAQEAEQEILSALIWSEQEISPLPHFYGTVQGE